MTQAPGHSPLYELQITGIGPLVDEFTAAGVWVFFRADAPSELTEFALLHESGPPQTAVAPGQRLTIGAEAYEITAVGDVANDNLQALGHLVLKANGATEPELPGDVCIAARPLPEPTVGLTLQFWPAAN